MLEQRLANGKRVKGGGRKDDGGALEKCPLGRAHLEHGLEFPGPSDELLVPKAGQSEHLDERDEHSPRVRSGDDDALEQDPSDDLGQRDGRRACRRGRLDLGRKQVQEQVREPVGVGRRMAEVVDDGRDQVVLACRCERETTSCQSESCKGERRRSDAPSLSSMVAILSMAATEGWLASNVQLTLIPPGESIR